MEFEKSKLPTSEGAEIQEEPISSDEKKETIEGVYSLNEKEIEDLMNSRGCLEEEVQTNDPSYKEKMEEALDKQRSYGQLRVKLFDRVLSGIASESEIKIAEKHAELLAKTFDLNGFVGIPKSWYSNERLASAMANSSESNREWVDQVRKNYTNEQLMKGGYEEIGEDGFAHTYAEKGY